ncbi:hypothetical protein TPA0909_53530 [Streptomyces albus]|nr:hypothetical protein TPA0909_53530 [Streptomyces albus]
MLRDVPAVEPAASGTDQGAAVVAEEPLRAGPAAAGQGEGVSSGWARAPSSAARVSWVSASRQAATLSLMASRGSDMRMLSATAAILRASASVCWRVLARVCCQATTPARSATVSSRQTAATPPPRRLLSRRRASWQAVRKSRSSRVRPGT